MSIDEIPDDRLGTVGHRPDGRSFVCFERRLPYPVETVWEAITDPEQLAVWFPAISLEAREGGRFELHFHGDCDGPADVTGTVHVFDPPHRLEMGSMSYRLTPTAEGCLLTFTDVLWFEGPRSEDEIAHAVLGGWHAYLDRLEHALAGGASEVEFPEPDYSQLHG